MTSEWPALAKVAEMRRELVKTRGNDYRQHIINQGMPRERADLCLSAMCHIKAQRLWTGGLHGADPQKMLDTALDLANYADFLAAYLLDNPVCCDHTPIQVPEWSTGKCAGAAIVAIDDSGDTRGMR